MEGFRTLALSLTAVCMLGGTILCLVPQGSMKTYLKLMVGVAVLIPLLISWQEVDRKSWADWTEEPWDSGSSLSAQGEKVASEAAADIIKAECEAYILDKAKRLAAEIQIDLELGEGLLPASVQIAGDLLPKQRNALEQILEEEMGIPKEAQHWSG